MKDSKFPVNFNAILELCRARLTELGHPERIDNWTYISGGAETGSTWRRNSEAYQSLGFIQTAINDVNPDAIDFSTHLLGADLRLPIGVAPMSSGISFVHDNAFAEIAKACASTGIIAGVGFPSPPDSAVTMLAHCRNSIKLLKPLKDFNLLVNELQRNSNEGCLATGIDIDSVAGLKTVADAGHFGEMTRPLSLSELKKARDSVKIPFIIKGVMSEQDVHSALEIGADAIVVSTHAGYALDYSPSPLEVLPRILKVVDGKMKVLVDSGITRGSDIIKALCLGADGVLIGRLTIIGLLLGGQEGVEWIINWLEEEMKRVMMLIGRQSITDLSPDCLVPLNQLGNQILGK